MNLTSEQRVIRTLKREEVDKVPTFEWLIDNKVIEEILPGGNYTDFVIKMGLDALCVDLDYKKEKIGDHLYKDEWGIVKQYSEEIHSVPISGPIKTMKDFKQYIPPDPYDKNRYNNLEKFIDKYGGDKAIILHLNDVFSIPSRLMKYEDFLISIIENPQLVKN